MSRANFRQADIERIIRAARNTGSIMHIDLRNLVVTVLPATETANPDQIVFVRDGKENWDED